MTPIQKKAKQKIVRLSDNIYADYLSDPVAIAKAFF